MVHPFHPVKPAFDNLEQDRCPGNIAEDQEHRQVRCFFLHWFRGGMNNMSSVLQRFTDRLIAGLTDGLLEYSRWDMFAHTDR